jgi:hypothetical protein
LRHAYDGQRDLIHELASVGTLGLFIAANRFNPYSSWRFSTYANVWVKKFIRLYAEELVSVVPRTGDRGAGLPRRSVMDLFEAALDGDRQYRGKAALPAVFDAKLLLDGIENEDGKLPDFEYLSTEGPTREYLQRPVRQKLYPWKDMGTYPFGTTAPRLEPDGEITPARVAQAAVIRASVGIMTALTAERARACQTSSADHQ